MDELSLRFERLAWVASLSLLLVAGAAHAQLPIQAPAPATEAPPSTPEPALSAAPAAASEPSPPAGAELPPAPEAPPGASAAPAPRPTSDGAAAPVPARSELLTDRSNGAPEPLLDDGDAGELGPRRTWYGWQTLTADGTSLALVLVGAAAANSERSGGDDGSNIAALGLLSYAFTPGIIHFVHRNPGRGFASFGVRIGLPIAAGMLGAALASGCNEYLCESEGAAIGGLLGVGGAIAIDAAVFAYDDRKPRLPSVGGLSPLVLIGHNRALVGVGGAL